MSAESLKRFAQRLYSDHRFYLLTCRNPAKAIALFGSSEFNTAEEAAIIDFATERNLEISANIDVLSGGILAISDLGSGVWC